MLIWSPCTLQCKNDLPWRYLYWYGVADDAGPHLLPGLREVQPATPVNALHMLAVVTVENHTAQLAAQLSSTNATILKNNDVKSSIQFETLSHPNFSKYLFYSMKFPSSQLSPFAHLILFPTAIILWGRCYCFPCLIFYSPHNLIFFPDWLDKLTFYTIYTPLP